MKSNLTIKSVFTSFSVLLIQSYAFNTDDKHAYQSGRLRNYRLLTESELDVTNFDADSELSFSNINPQARNLEELGLENGVLIQSSDVKLDLDGQASDSESGQEVGFMDDDLAAMARAEEDDFELTISNSSSITSNFRKQGKKDDDDRDNNFGDEDDDVGNENGGGNLADVNDDVDNENGDSNLADVDDDVDNENGDNIGNDEDDDVNNENDGFDVNGADDVGNDAFDEDDDDENGVVLDDENEQVYDEDQDGTNFDVYNDDNKPDPITSLDFKANEDDRPVSENFSQNKKDKSTKTDKPSEADNDWLKFEILSVTENGFFYMLLIVGCCISGYACWQFKNNNYNFNQPGSSQIQYSRIPTNPSQTNSINGNSQFGKGYVPITPDVLRIN